MSVWKGLNFNLSLSLNVPALKFLFEIPNFGEPVQFYLAFPACGLNIIFWVDILNQCL